MSTRHTHGITRRTAEHLLDGTAGTGPDELHRVLSAARAPGREGELAGEHLAVASFEANHLGPVATPPRRKIMNPLTKLLSVKVVAWSLAAVVTGGAAAAVGTVAFSSSAPSSSTPSASVNANAGTSVAGVGGTGAA